MYVLNFEINELAKMLSNSKLVYKIEKYMWQKFIKILDS